MTKKLGEEIEIRTHVIPVFHEWPAKDIWKMIKPNLYLNADGKYEAKPFARKPDGEPTHWDIIMVRGGKDYERAGDSDCNCDLTSGDICPHWSIII